MGERLRFLDDPASFLTEAARYLLDRPVRSTVVATQAHREAAAGQRCSPEPSSDPHWYVVVRDDAGEVVGAAMRTAGYPPYLLDMPETSAAVLAGVLLDRGESVEACNGALPAARILAEQIASRTGRRAEVMVHTRLFEVSTLIEPRAAPGRLRRARFDDLDLTIDWFRDFLPAADAQSGRSPWGHHPQVARGDVAGRIEAGGVWLWENPVGTPVHLTCAHPPALGVRRIGPVYTPAEHRGHGYASTAVTEVSRMILAEGARACLFTDRANPVSNGIYEAIGYRPVLEMANLVVREVP